MRRADRPHAVRRWLRRPLLWLVAALALAAWLTYLDERDARATARAFDRGVHVTARPDPDWDGEGHLSLRYVHPSGQAVRAHTTIWRAAVRPAGGEPLEVVVSTEDPTSVRVVGDVAHRSHPVQYLLFAVPALAVWALRRWSFRRSLQLVEGGVPAYQMHAVASSPGWWSSRWRLHLFALDSKPGALPVCTLPLIAPPSHLGERVVEVKGAPRPWGRAVVRDQASQEVLWPTGRGLRAHGWRRSSLEPGRSVAPSRSARWLMVGGIAVFVLGMVVDVFVDESQDTEERAYRMDAVVVGSRAGSDGLDARVRVVWLGEPIEATVNTSTPLAPGASVDVLLDPADPTRVWAVGEEPPGRAIVGVFYLVGLMAVVAGAIKRLALRREARRPHPPPLRRPPPFPEPPPAW